MTMRRKGSLPAIQALFRLAQADITQALNVFANG